MVKFSLFLMILKQKLLTFNSMPSRYLKICYIDDDEDTAVEIPCTFRKCPIKPLVLLVPFSPYNSSAFFALSQQITLRRNNLMFLISPLLSKDKTTCIHYTLISWQLTCKYKWKKQLYPKTKSILAYGELCFIVWWCFIV